MPISTASRTRFCSAAGVPKTSKVTPGFQIAESRIAAMMSAIRMKVDASAECGSAPAFSMRVSASRRGARTRGRPRRTARARRTETIAVCSHRCCAVQKKSTPCRKPTKSGGSPSGRQRAADIGDQDDEEDDDMHIAGARRVGPQQRPDQDHGGAGGADDARDAGAERQNAGIDRRRAAQVAGHENAARDRVEREQEHDEAQIFRDDGVHEGFESALARRKRARSGASASAAQTVAIFP